MSIATIGAFAIGEYPEAVAVMLLYNLGELFEDLAEDKSKKSIESLMEIRPDFVNVNKDGSLVKVNPEEVLVDQIICIKPGEKVPLDGIVIEGSSFLDTSVLTGESVPKEVKENDEILAGMINKTSPLMVKVTKPFAESTVSKILELVKNASNRKAKSENFITKFAKIYTPVVVLIAVILAIVPPLIWGDFIGWLYKALSFLVVSCPCALVISIPLGFFAGIGASAKSGILVKGGNYLEALTKTKVIAFDKTGTLTKGVFKVQKVNAVNISEEDLIKFAAIAENYSNHPIADSIKKAYGKKIDSSSILKNEELAGLGIEAVTNENTILIGNEKLMNEKNIEYVKSSDIGTILYVAIDQKFAGTILISDEIKEDAKQAISSLKSQNISKIVMLTGDRSEVAENVSNTLGLDKFYAQLMPDEKAKILENLLKNKNKGEKVAFVGDGVNDSPSLALSDIGIAMGGLGSDAAIEAADVVIMTDEPSKIAKVIKIAKKTNRIVKENIIFAISVKVIILLLTLFGVSNMWQAVFADVGVSILAVLNSLRTLKA